MNLEKILEINGIQKTYETASESLHILKGIDLTVNRGEIISIMGPSGSGKSTLLNILGLLDAYDEGTYHLAGIDVGSLQSSQKQKIRLQKIGFIFQTFNLIQTLNVRQNIELPMALAKVPQEEQAKRSTGLLERFGLFEKAKKFPHQLSIGEQQRVAISRALVNEPVLVLCDEPTGNLDEANSEIILSYLASLRELNTSIIIVSHSPATKNITDTNYILTKGILKRDL